MLWWSAVFERAFDYFRTNAAELKEERAMLLEEWLKKELSFGDLGDVTLVQKKAPRKVKRKRPLPSDDGSNIAYALFSVLYSWYCILDVGGLPCYVSMCDPRSIKKLDDSPGVAAGISSKIMSIIFFSDQISQIRETTGLQHLR